MRKIKQVYIPYWDWEDYKNGMWRRVDRDTENELLQQCIEFTSNWFDYGSAMREVIDLWPNTMLNSLTSPSVNKRAFLGHCAVSLKLNCPEYITRMAWSRLTESQRIKADKVAQFIINKWYDRQDN